MILGGTCRSFRLELLEGIHDLRVDVLKIALYTSAANLDPTTITAYTPTGEAVSGEWLAGGLAITTQPTFPKIDPATGQAVWTFQSITTPFDTTLTFRAALVYNSSKANRAICIVDKGVDVVVTGGPVRLFANPFNPYVIKVA